MKSKFRQTIKSTTESVRAIDRREALFYIAAGAFALATAGAGYQLLREKTLSSPFQQIGRTLGQPKVIPIPDKWYWDLETPSIDSSQLSKENIDTLTKNMEPTYYNRVCNSNPGAAMPTTKYGMNLVDAMNRTDTYCISSSSLISIESTDWYTLVAEDPKKVFLSVSKNNIPEEYWHGKGYEHAKKAKVTYSGVFFPEEHAQAWKDLVDVNNINSVYDDTKPGTYFRGPDGRIIQPEHKDISMNLDNLVLTLERPNQPPLRIYYTGFRNIAEANFTIEQNQPEPHIPIKEILEYGQIKEERVGLVFHANNYAVSVPPWRQDNLSVIFDKKYEKYGVPTKLTGGEFLNKAGRIGGFYKIEVVPF